MELYTSIKHIININDSHKCSGHYRINLMYMNMLMNMNLHVFLHCCFAVESENMLMYRTHTHTDEMMFLIQTQINTCDWLSSTHTCCNRRRQQKHVTLLFITCVLFHIQKNCLRWLILWTVFRWCVMLIHGLFLWSVCWYFIGGFRFHPGWFISDWNSNNHVSLSQILLMRDASHHSSL